MKTMLKKSFALILALTLVLGAAPLAGLVGLELPNSKDIFTDKAEAAMENGTCGTHLSYTIDTDIGVLTISGTGDMYNWTFSSQAPWCGYGNIKTVVIGNGVTSIGDRAFERCYNLTSVTIPDSVTSIGNWAFEWCNSLLSIVVAENNQYFSNDENGILYNKDKTELVQYPVGNTRTSYTITDSVISIGDYAFMGCDSLTSVAIGKGVTSIGDYAFAWCDSLTSVTIPDSVKRIGSSAFYDTGILNNSSNWENYVLYIDNHLIKAKEEISGSYSIKTGTKTIAGGAFEWCDSLTSVTISDSVTSIGKSAFYDCNGLTSVAIGNGVTSIGDYAFDGCTGLTSITIPDSVTRIGNKAFHFCHGLTSITIPKSVVSIGEEAFSYCSRLTSIAVAKGNQNFSNDEYGVLFDKNKTELIQYPIGNTGTSYIIPVSVTSIRNCAFKWCKKLLSIVTDEKNQYFSNDNYGVLFNKDKTELIQYPIGNTRTTYTIPDGVTRIDDGAFSQCNGLINITIPDSVTSIGDTAFAWCVNIASVTIPDSVTSIGRQAFDGCTGLTNIYYTGSETDWNIISIDMPNDFLTNANIHFQYIPLKNIYNLGEETYSFNNFRDSYSKGHCFGMSITSSGYYLGKLNIDSVCGNSGKSLHSLNKTSAVTEPICYYQNLQGSFANYAVVAGGSWYLSKEKADSDYDIESDWEEVINYVKDHKHDNNGNLQIGFRKNNKGGHSVNFLYFKEVNGQQRIYAYDNNFPKEETYFYKNSNGEILQAPHSTFSGSIDCISLRSVELYYSVVESANTDRFVYGLEEDIRIDGMSGYPLEQGETDNEKIMYEIPEGNDTVVITPLKDNAKFTYLGAEYSFGKVNEDTRGVLTLGESEGNTLTETPVFNIVNGEKMSIRVPSSTTISYGDSIILHSDVYGTFAEGARIEWTADNGNFDMSVSADGTACKISPKSSGKTVFTATVYDKDGNVISSDTQEMTAKAGFFDKIVAFFKKIFGLTKTFPEAFKGIF